MAFYEYTFVGKQDLSDKEIDNLVSKYDYCGGNIYHPDSYKKEIIYNDDENTHYIIHNYYYDTESG